MCTEILHKFLPGLAPEIDDYVCGTFLVLILKSSTDFTVNGDLTCVVGVLSEIDDFESAEDIVDALGAILLESHEEATQEIVNELCGHLFTTLKGYVFVRGIKCTRGLARAYVLL